MGSENPLHLLDMRGHAKDTRKLFIHAQNDFFTPPASGSFSHQGMAIVPCAMRSIGNLAAGIGDNLIHRAADVSLKEKRPLILVPREAPFNAIHLENLLTLHRAGATILPASPAFYHHPQSVEALVDTTVARILDHLGCPQDLVPPWQQP
jgi:4-hydroxy-3-polyprenylbenzoate decarboxylase